MERVVAILFLCLALLAASISLCSGYDNTVTVSAIGGDFTTVSAALASITDASATNRYLIKVFPGTYDGQVVCKPYVDIVGEGRSAVVLTDDVGPTLVLKDHEYIANMTVKCTAIDGTAISGLGGGFTKVENVYAEADGWAMTADGFWGWYGPSPDRESATEEWVTFHDCSFKGNKGIATLWDSLVAENCTFTQNTSGSTCGYAIEIAGNAIMRDCLVNVTLTGAVTSEYGAIFHTDYASPTRLERTSISVRVLNANSTGLIYGVKNGHFDEPVSGRIDIDHCSFQVINNGSGATYDIINAFNHPEFLWSSPHVFATKYDPEHTYGDIIIVSQGDQVVRNLEVTGNLTVSGETTVVLPDKDRTRVFPLFVTGPTVGFRNILGDAYASPVVGYSFPDDVTLSRITVIFTSPGTAWLSDANPEGQLILFKNDDSLGGADLINMTGDTAVLSCTWPLDEEFTPQDKLSMTLEGISEVSDVSIVIEYTVD